MNFEQVDERLANAKNNDGSYDGHAISEMNEEGVRFAFLRTGVRWKTSDWTKDEIDRFIQEKGDDNINIAPNGIIRVTEGCGAISGNVVCM